jgi:hypothetical protein
VYHGAGVDPARSEDGCMYLGTAGLFGYEYPSGINAEGNGKAEVMRSERRVYVKNYWIQS